MLFLNIFVVLLQKLENSTYIDSSATEDWLREFLDYVERNKGYADIDLPISTELDFATTLRHEFISDPTTPKRLDVAFNDDKTRVVAARFLIQVRSVMLQRYRIGNFAPVTHDHLCFHIFSFPLQNDLQNVAYKSFNVIKLDLKILFVRKKQFLSLVMFAKICMLC